MTYIGIDPGAGGGIAVITKYGQGWVSNAVPMPATERDVWEWVSNPMPDSFAVIEKVHSMPGQGVASTFKFGVSYGGLRMALVAAGIPFEEVSPQRWQKVLGIPPRKKEETKTRWKNRLKALAQQYFPQEKVTLAVADALLIALYCKRAHGGK